jgi:hypothetical protein
MDRVMHIPGVRDTKRKVGIKTVRIVEFIVQLNSYGVITAVDRKYRRAATCGCLKAEIPDGLFCPNNLLWHTIHPENIDNLLQNQGPVKNCFPHVFRTSFILSA